jgi:hypothetical protein
MGQRSLSDFSAIWRSRRHTYFVGLIAVSVIGIASRVFYIGSLVADKYLGDALYAIAFYLFLGLVWDRATPGVKAGLTLTFVLAVETFQLTGIPWRLSQSDWFLWRVASVLLGTQFSWWDIVAYVVGIATIYAVDRFYTSELE